MLLIMSQLVASLWANGWESTGSSFSVLIQQVTRCCFQLQPSAIKADTCMGGICVQHTAAPPAALNHTMTSSTACRAT